jgi:hypothetical protein
MNHAMRSIFLLLSLASSLFAATPNFVWIIADDMSPDTGRMAWRR